MRYLTSHLGISTADANNIRLSYSKGDLTVDFNDWQEKPIRLFFSDVLGFIWQDELDTDVIRDDEAYIVEDLQWLISQSRLANEEPEDFTHHKLCFNTQGVLDVISRQVDHQSIESDVS